MCQTHDSRKVLQTAIHMLAAEVQTIVVCQVQLCCKVRNWRCICDEVKYRRRSSVNDQNIWSGPELRQAFGVVGRHCLQQHINARGYCVKSNSVFIIGQPHIATPELMGSLRWRRPSVPWSTSRSSDRHSTEFFVGLPGPSFLIYLNIAPTITRIGRHPSCYLTTPPPPPSE